MADYSAATVNEKETPINTETPKPVVVSPAQDLRDIQYLLLNGIFPGNVAPSVVKSYHLLEQMAVQVEAVAKVSVEAK